MSALKFAVAGVLALTMFSGANAQSYPDRPMRLIVPFGAGGITDIIARQLGKDMGDALGQPMVIENRPGAGGVIAAQAAVASAADGYTLFMGTVGTQIVNPLIMKTVGYNPDTQLVPIGMVSGSPYVFAIRSSLEAKTFEAFVAYAKKHPGTLNFGSAGNGSSPHLGLELLNMTASIDVLHIPFKSGGEAVNAALGGQVDAVMDAISVVMPHVKSGKLRALALTAPERSPAAPDVPTSGQAGDAALQMSSWNALLVPAGTPAAVTAKLNAVLQKVLANEALRTKLAAQGSELYKGTPEEYQSTLGIEKTKWTGIVKRANIRLD